MRLITGADRGQMTLFAHRLEDMIAEDNEVRLINAFIDALDMSVPRLPHQRGNDAADGHAHPKPHRHLHLSEPPHALGNVFCTYNRFLDRSFGAFGKETVAIDGDKFRAQNSKKNAMARKFATPFRN